MEKLKVDAMEMNTKIMAKPNEMIELLVYSAAALLVPFLLGHPQLLVGILVNTSLVLAALNLKNYKVLPVALLPSMGVIARGLIFGPFTVFLVYMVPFIWIGNLILVILVQKISNKSLAFILGAVVKAAFLYTVAILLIKMGVLPKVFSTSMGVIQLYTALAGGVLALVIQGLKNKVTKTS